MKSYLYLAVCTAVGTISLQAQANEQQDMATITREMAAGAGAKLACSGVFLQNRTPENVVQRDLRPIAYPLLKEVEFGFDQNTKIATAIAGDVKRSALYRPGVGCTLMLDNSTPDQLLEQAEEIADNFRPGRAQEWPLGDEVSMDRNRRDVDWEKLDAAVDAAFVDASEHQTVDTRAVLVVYQGKIVAEKYAEGFNQESRFLAWSASKSVASALIGTMVTRNKLALDEAAPVSEWSAEGDARGQITLRSLLNMTSGLEFTEPYIPGNDSTNMLFREGYMAKYAANKPAETAPDTKWYYSSGTTNILSHILFDAVGGTLQDVHTYAWDHFFKPVGMTSAVFEPDVSGSHVGSSYFYATAQDWARFGLLFLNEGMVGDKQVLSREWVAYTRSVTPLAPKGMYGAQFWHNRGSLDNEEDRMLVGAPKDLFMAAGYAGQHIAIVPSKDAVVIRFGWTNRGEKFDVNKHFSEILNALPEK